MAQPFNFPFPPYPIQLLLMRHLHTVLGARGISIVESPTGTGKSLSLLCAALSHLQSLHVQQRARVENELRQNYPADEPEWVLEQDIASTLRRLDADTVELEERLAKVREMERTRERKKLKTWHNEKRPHELAGDEGDYAPEDYDDDKDAIDKDGLSRKVLDLMKEMASKYTPTVDAVDPIVPKIFYASRTHSQLSQFVSEVRKTSFIAAPSLVASVGSSSASPGHPPVRVIPLGSRQQLCINEELRARTGGSNEALGEICLELQSGKGPKDKDGKHTSTKGCRCLPGKDEPGRMREFTDAALATVHDIEDIEDLGRKMNCCPYYGTRKAINSAQLVVLPYNLLLKKSAREALGIDLTDQVVIVDEAHNLIDVLLSLNSQSISLSSLPQLISALKVYQKRYQKLLKGSNAMYLKQFLAVLTGLEGFGARWKGKGKGGEGMLGVNELMEGMGGTLDTINLLTLVQWLAESKIGRKIGGYSESIAEKEATAAGKSVQALNKDQVRKQIQAVQSFLEKLSAKERDGRVLISQNAVTVGEGSKGVQGGGGKGAGMVLEYLLLNPSEIFRDLTESAASIILAGGTMTPLSDFRTQLFPYVDDLRYSTFSCGHIVPPEQVKTFAMGLGAKGGKLEFNYKTRDDASLMDELGQSILNIANVVPAGIVVFVPSYLFLDKLSARWTATSLLARLGAKKPVFSEPRDAGSSDKVLRGFSDAALNQGGGGKGAILFAVVGAKLSEGINFSDDLARAVIICGIPYPNATSLTLKERMSYLDSTHPVPPGSPTAGQVLYSNLAFRAVNQSIGRAIRHQKDWAAIILLDARYLGKGAQTKLPGWLRGAAPLVPGAAEVDVGGVSTPKTFGNFMGMINRVALASYSQD